MQISPTHYRFKISNRKLVLPLFKNLGESFKVNRPSKFKKKKNQNSFLIRNIENNFICNNARNIRTFTIYCNLKCSIKKRFIPPFYHLCESSQVNCPIKKNPFVRMVPGGNGFCANSPVTVLGWIARKVLKHGISLVLRYVLCSYLSLFYL